VSRARLEVVAEQAAQLREDARLDRRVQAVAAQVHAHPGHGAARGGPADVGRALHHDHPVAGAGGLLRGPDPGGARPQDDQIGVGGAQLAE